MKIWKPTASAAFGAALFLGVFAASAFLNTVSAADLTGSGALRSEEESAGDFGREIISIAYINREGKVESRPIVLYRPANASGDLPLVYVPHYPIDESAPVFKEYMARGWAAASPTEFKPEYNGRLADDNLVFNNAALYTLRRRAGIDRQRIAVVGGSAGGYTALMLCELQMGVCAAVAHSPVANLYYNFAVYFRKCDELNAAAGEGGLPVPVQGMISSTFRPINDSFSGADDPRWEALSPVALIQCLSSPVVVNHYTADVLVPVDQITKRFAYADDDGSFPDGFPIRMGVGYPGVLSRSLEEEANPAELSAARYPVENRHVDMDMPYSDKLLTINILDDGPMNAKGSHTAPGTTGGVNTIPYLEAMFSQTLAKTERAVPEKLLLMLERYRGKSAQLPAHENADDAVYGSLAVYQEEIVDELARYAANRSPAELDEAAAAAIKSAEDADALTKVWAEIKSKIKE